MGDWNSVQCKKYVMLKYVLNICLISFFVIHLINADVVRQNRRVKRLGTGGRNATHKFKKGEIFCVAYQFKKRVFSMSLWQHNSVQHLLQFLQLICVILFGFYRNMEARCWWPIPNRAINTGHSKCAFEMWFKFNVCQIRDRFRFYGRHVHQRQFLRSEWAVLYSIEKRTRYSESVNAIFIWSVQYELRWKRLYQYDCCSKWSRTRDARRCCVRACVRFPKAKKLECRSQLRNERQVNLIWTD